MASGYGYLPPAPRWQISLERCVVLLTLAAWSVRAVMHVGHLDLPEHLQWLDAVLALVTTVATLLGLSRELPGQNVIGAGFVVGVIGAGAHALTIMVGVPFGPLVFTPQSGPSVAGTVPWVMPLIWVPLVLNARGVARLVLRSGRSGKSRGWWMVLLSAALVAATGLILEVAASRGLRLWLWQTPADVPAWYGVPLTALVSWFAVAAIATMFATPLLLNKQPGPPLTPSLSPVFLFACINLFSAAVCAGKELWSAASAGAGLALLVLSSAVWARLQRAPNAPP